MKHNDIFGTEYAVVDESSFIFARAGEGAFTSCKKSDIFCEMDKGAVRLCDGRLELAEETFCKILSDCRGERDMDLMKLEKITTSLPTRKRKETQQV